MVALNSDESKFDTINYEEEFDEYLDVGTNVSGTYLYLFAPVTYDFLSKENRNEAIRIGYVSAFTFHEFIRFHYLT